MTARAFDGEDLVRRTARLARLELDPRSIPELARQFERILEAFQELNEIDIEGVEPLYTPLEQPDFAREDRARASLDRDALLANAPQSIEGFLGVPKTIGGEI